MKKTFALTAALAALALTGCVQVPEFKAAPETMPAVQPTEKGKESLADRAINSWLDSYGANSVDALTYPYQTVSSWETDSKNNLIVHTKKGGNVELDMQAIAENIKFNVPEEIGSVTVTNENGDSVTYPK